MKREGKGGHSVWCLLLLLVLVLYHARLSLLRLEAFKGFGELGRLSELEVRDGMTTLCSIYGLGCVKYLTLTKLACFLSKKQEGGS